METSSPTTVDNLIFTAYHAGSPRLQVENFLGRGYMPYPWQWRFHAAARLADTDNGPVKIGVGGARGPGKSHSVFAQVALDDCQRVEGLKGLFLRQTGKAASESFEDLLTKILSGKVDFKYSQGVLRFPNKSKVVLGGFETDRDIDKYIGIEYDFIAIEEINQLTEDKIIKLLGSMRTSKANWRPRLYTSFNPSGIGHVFVKRWFVDPFIQNVERETRFIPATYKDNPMLNKEYIQYLEGLQGKLGKAWREGNFDILEGQFFEEWSREQHVIAPYAFSSSFKKFRAYDHGHTAPACCKWYFLDYDGNLTVYRELYQAGWNVDQLATEINRLSVGEHYDYSVADPSIFANQGFVDKSGGQTIAEGFARNGIMFLPASNRRVDGWSLMHQYLAWSVGKKPKLRYFSTCYDSIRTIPTLIHDDLRPEDLDTEGEDHAGDCDRYMLVSLHERKTAEPLNDLQQKLKQMQQAQAISPQNLNKFYSGE